MPQETATPRSPNATTRQALKAELASTVECTERQLCLLSWFFEQYDETLPAAHIIRDEEMAATDGRALSAVIPTTGPLEGSLESKSLNEAHGSNEMCLLGERLLEREEAFYSRQSVEERLLEIA